jgi:predicted Zn finger-like uncharacterized protein
MIITCPACQTRYKVDPASFGPKGRRVRCTNCENTWTQTSPDDAPKAVDPEAPLDEEAPEAGAEAAAEETPEETPEPGAEPAEEPAKAAVAVEEAPRAAHEEAPRATPDAKAPQAGGEGEGAAKLDLPTVAAAGPNRPAADDGTSAARENRAKVLGWVALVSVVAAILVGGALTRDSIVRAWPPAERIYQAAGFASQGTAAGLRIEVVSHDHAVQDDRTILVVKGKVTNTSARVREVPKLQAWIRGEDSRELANWTFTAAQTRLLPGETASFVTRFQNPPAGGTGLAIDFSQEGD